MLRFLFSSQNGRPAILLRIILLICACLTLSLAYVIKLNLTVTDALIASASLSLNIQKIQLAASTYRNDQDSAKALREIEAAKQDWAANIANIQALMFSEENQNRLNQDNESFTVFAAKAVSLVNGSSEVTLKDLSDSSMDIASRLEEARTTEPAKIHAMITKLRNTLLTIYLLLACTALGLTFLPRQPRISKPATTAPTSQSKPDDFIRTIEPQR